MTSVSREFPEVIFRYDGIPSEELNGWKKSQREKVKRFLRTPRADKLYKEIITTIQSFASTAWARERIPLFAPVSDFQDITRIQRLVRHAMNTIEKIDPVTMLEIKRYLKDVSIPVLPPPHYDSSVGIVAENDEIYDSFVERRVNRWCPIYTPSSLNPDSELLLYVYDVGNLDIDGENVVMVPMDSRMEALVPESIISFFKGNRTILEAAHVVQKLRGKMSIMEKVLGLLSPPEQGEVVDVRRIADEALDLAMDHFKEAVKGLKIEGRAILEFLGTGIPESIKKPLHEAEVRALNYFRERTGLDLIIDASHFPFTLDKEEVENAVRRQRSLKRKREFENAVRSARELKSLKEEVVEEITSLLEFDLFSSLGEFVRKYSLQFPELKPDGDTFVFKGAAHLKLVKINKQVRVDYSFGGKDNVVLLTGANSGGKTTLLETIAQTLILARMGFPVCCAGAELPVMEELYLHSQKKELNAGAFESFLRSFIPVVKSGKRKLILADELEAITELDAGARIIATVLSRVKGSDSFAVVVSHMSEEIGRRLQVRIDGIEATGLDENLNLIVERTPRIGYRARSTPELIVRRLYSLSKGEEREIYGSILENFRDD